MAESKQDGQQWWDERPEAARRRWLWPRNVVLFTVLALLTWAGVFLYGVMYAEPVISVDYRPRLVEMVRKKQGMPEGAENGWVILRGLADTSVRVYQEAKAAAEKQGIEPVFDPTYLYNPAEHIDDEAKRGGFKSLALQYVDDMRRAGIFAELNRLRRMPFGVRISPEERLLDYMVPEVGASRLFTRTNLARMHLAHQRGDEDERFEALEQCVAMAQLESRQGSPIEYHVGVAIDFAAMNEIRQELLERPATEAECVRLMEVFEASPLATPEAALEGERLLELDTIQTVFSDTGGGSGRVLITEVNKLGADEQQRAAGIGLEPWLDYKVCNLAGLFLPGRQENVEKINHFFDTVIEQAKLTRQERLGHAFDPTEFMEQLPRSYPFLHFLLPDASKTLFVQDQSRLERAAMRLMLAIELHRARTGAYPESMADLVPSVLPEVPLDPFTGKSFGYKRLAKGEDADGRAYLLYSYGADETDDGGRAPKNSQDALSRTKGAGTDYIINRPRPKPTPQPAESGDGE